MRIRVWKQYGVWQWAIMRPGYILGGCAPTWPRAIRSIRRELGLPPSG